MGLGARSLISGSHAWRTDCQVHGREYGGRGCIWKAPIARRAYVRGPPGADISSPRTRLRSQSLRRIPPGTYSVAHCRRQGNGSSPQERPRWREQRALDQLPQRVQLGELHLTSTLASSATSAWRSASICKRAMPSWQGALTMEQIEDLWVYVSTHAYQQ